MKKILSLLTCIVLCISMFVFAANGAARPGYTSSEEWEVLRLVNQYRAENGAGALSTFTALDNAASIRSEELITVFEHTRPDGSSCFTALNGIQYYSCGENIAEGYGTPSSVMTAWMNSTGHRANILNSNYKHIGVGYTYKQNTLYRHHWTQLFVGGCTTTSIAIPNLSSIVLQAGVPIEEQGLMLEVTCNMHGKSYLPLTSDIATCDTSKVGNTTLVVTYDGIGKGFPVQVGFSDVAPTAWYSKNVYKAVELNLFQGTTPSTFEPDTKMTRGMLVTVLHRLEGKPTAKVSAFQDIPQNAWYAKAVNWAAQNGIVNGISKTKFDPDSPVTREQIATILYRYAGYKNNRNEAVGDLSAFKDKNKVSAFAQKAMTWAVGNQIITGKNGNQLDPQGLGSRAEVATIMVRYQNLIQ